MAVANDGVVGSPVSYPSGSEPGTIKSKDVDKDGKGDYVASNEESGTATLLKQSSTRGFEPPVMLPLGDAAGSLTVVDVDGDGDQDIVAVVDDGLGAEVRVLRNDMNLYGDEQLVFAAAATLETDVVPALLDAGDIDVDGYADLITIGSPRIQRRGAHDRIGSPPQPALSRRRRWRWCGRCTGSARDHLELGALPGVRVGHQRRRPGRHS